MQKLLKKILIVITVCIVYTTFLSINYEKEQINENYSSASTRQEIPVFCYHDVEDNEKNIVNDPYAITTKRLEEHFKLFKEYGYTPISVKQYEDYLSGKAKLPDKPIILTFDDGRISMYSDIYPLLKKYDYPALYAIILSYMDNDNLPSDIKQMVSWNQLQEMENSGLVTIATHTYNLHNYIVANKQGDRSQSAQTLYWNDKLNRYETIEEFKQRIRDDMQKSQEILKSKLGLNSNILVWPYGAYNEISAQIAEKAGFKFQFMLDDDKATNNPQRLSRYIIMKETTDKNLLDMLNHKHKQEPVISAQLALDMIYDDFPAKTEQNIDKAIAKLANMNVNTVYIQAFADEDGDGNIDQVYFMNDKVKVKADLLSHVIYRLNEQLGNVKIYAWIPVLSYDFMTDDGNNVILADQKEHAGWYKRATPFNEKTKIDAESLITSLAAYNNIDGILFQDDLYMNDFEDYSIYGQRAFYEAFGKPLNKDSLQDKDIKRRWSELKTETLNDLTVDLANKAKVFRPNLKVARNIYPIVITDKNAQEWFAQNFEDYLELYDYVVVMLYPEMEGVDDADLWIKDVVNKSLISPQAQAKVVFKLQGYDWNTEAWISHDLMKHRIDLIKSEHGLNIAQYPVNIFDYK